VKDSNYLKPVKAQYEALPYPQRDPVDEKHRLVPSMGGCLFGINHYCFRGQKDFSRGFRCLIAGGGTGDSAIFLAEQLRDFDAEIVYLDFSAASREVAAARAQARGLDNITWITDSLLEIPKLGLGQFDFINCSGVLHHLESTEDGLAVLADALKPDGGMYLMLYGQYGRQSVYDMQQLLRTCLPTGADPQTRIDMTRELLKALPESNSWSRNRAKWVNEISTDAGLFDLLLHSQDRCFTVPQLYQLLDSAGLHLQGFTGDHMADYDPMDSVTDGRVQSRLRDLNSRDRQAAGEQLRGNIIKHEFFVTKQTNAVASLNDESNALLGYNGLNVDAPYMAEGMTD
jgi:SAM-dependent methyltransferase